MALLLFAKDVDMIIEIELRTSSSKTEFKVTNKNAMVLQTMEVR